MEHVKPPSDQLLDAEDHCQCRFPHDAIVFGVSTVFGGHLDYSYPVGTLVVTDGEVNPADPSVLTVGSFNAGTAENVIAGSARLTGTIRTLRPEVRSHLREAMARMAGAIGKLHGCQVDPEVREGNPPVVNPPR